MIRPLSALFGLFSRDLGIDLGTANTLVYVRGKGIVISEPSVVAVDIKSKRALAVGVEAKAMVGKTPGSIIAVRPLKDGVIADFDTVEMMLHYFIRKVHLQRFMAPHPRVVIGIPSGVTEVEKRAAKDAALSAGAREAYTIEEPIAAAIMEIAIVHAGGKTSEVQLDSKVHCMHENVVTAIWEQHGLRSHPPTVSVEAEAPLQLLAGQALLHRLHEVPSDDQANLRSVKR
jgi:rod shape-determining protein MreB